MPGGGAPAVSHSPPRSHFFNMQTYNETKLQELIEKLDEFIYIMAHHDDAHERAITRACFEGRDEDEDEEECQMCGG